MNKLLALLMLKDIAQKKQLSTLTKFSLLPPKVSIVQLAICCKSVLQRVRKNLVKRILVIEDEPAIRLGMVRLLLLHKFNVVEAADGEMGLLLSKTIHPDLILCDINLPVVNGFEILRQVRGNSATTFTPFVVTTSQTDQKIYQRSLELGANHFFNKPISFDKLLTVVNHHLGISNS
ncbi:response regulator [Leptolyngbya sp. CCNP1308]|uniref:response regulator n=1 Tax=Leptolyngbya sp. CCNP1308 TaxID=3110255 RepID=UPI002B21B1E3|nr:response regulator [Leptolyngbya sp. CCNP1308]MEA5452407.1 response regulator [Leptolyngbya sp. CCNP1308]